MGEDEVVGDVAICGEDEDDLSDDFRGLPLDSKIGVEVVRETLGRRGGAGEVGEERGKGTAAG